MHIHISHIHAYTHIHKHGRACGTQVEATANLLKTLWKSRNCKHTYIQIIHTHIHTYTGQYTSYVTHRSQIHTLTYTNMGTQVEVTANLLKTAIEKHSHWCDMFLIDGFPRNMENLRGWEKICGKSVVIEKMLVMECSEGIMTRRLLQRGKTSGRVDDNAATIKKRLATHVQETMPVVRHFERRGKLVRVDADRPVPTVYSEVRKIMEPIMQRRLLGRRLLGGRLPSIRTLLKGSLVYAVIAAAMKLLISKRASGTV
jgi:adenylate kinase family enzyme